MALAGYGDFDDTVDTIADLPVSYLIAGFGLALSNYLFRYFRWCYYLRVLKIRVHARLNLLVFFQASLCLQHRVKWVSW